MLSLIAALSFVYGNAVVTLMTFFHRAGYDLAVLFLLVYFGVTLWPFRCQSLPERIANGASRDRLGMTTPFSFLFRENDNEMVEDLQIGQR